MGAFYSGVQDLESAISKKSARQTQRAFAKMSLAYDHYLKAGNLYLYLEFYIIFDIFIIFILYYID